MAALAGMLAARGYRVTGSDNQLYEPTASLLKGLRIDIRNSYDAANLTPAPDLVVVGNVVPRANPEAQALLASSIPYVSMPEALWHLFLRDRRVLMVAGTHGKTTSTAMMAHVLEAAGRDPSMLVGGVAHDFGTNYRLGGGPDFVIEGDEYDTAFFDKGPKFLHYRANGAIITAVEFDHADIYRDLDHVKSSFRTLVAQMDGPARPSRCRTRCARWAQRTSGAPRSPSRRTRTTNSRSGASRGCSWFAPTFRMRSRSAPCACAPPHLRPQSRRVPRDRYRDRSGWRTLLDRTRWCIASRPILELPIGGRMNVANALGVWVLLREFGLGDDELARGLRTFAGVKRRQEIVGEARGITLSTTSLIIRRRSASRSRRSPSATLAAASWPRSSRARILRAAASFSTALPPPSIAPREFIWVRSISRRTIRFRQATGSIPTRSLPRLQPAAPLRLPSPPPTRSSNG